MRERSLRLDTKHLAQHARAAVPKPSILANSGGVGRKFHHTPTGEAKKNLLSLRHFVLLFVLVVVGCVRLRKLPQGLQVQC
ncbi:hypothetical protein HDV62DRAFT_374646 [Trichoderma sp. SZMC 28011]